MMELYKMSMRDAIGNVLHDPEIYARLWDKWPSTLRTLLVDRMAVPADTPLCLLPQYAEYLDGEDKRPIWVPADYNG